MSVKASPVYNVLRVHHSKIKANAWNPNSVAPPQMKLLELSIWEDGYTMPIVTYYIKEEDVYEIVDGYHRFTVLMSSKRVFDREEGYLPVAVIDKPVSDRMASTVRHNNARGTHDVSLMQGMVSDLVAAGKGDAWIQRKLGMDADELLRLKQMTGLASLFKDQSYSKAWSVSCD